MKYYDYFEDEDEEDWEEDWAGYGERNFTPDSPGIRCNCEDAPCCGCNQ